MERAVAQRPTDATYLNSLGSALLEAARYDEAIDALRRATEARAGLRLGLVQPRPRLRAQHASRTKPFRH